MNGKMRKVRGLLAGKDPKTIAYFFLDRSIILLQEAKEEKAKVIDYINEKWK